MSRRLIACVVVGQFLALVVVCWVVGDNGWDDGAITLAFSRTLARHGRVALTGSSEVVEGFSSVAWFLVNALVALARPSYRAAIFASQVLSAACISACTLLMARTCALLRLEKPFSVAALATFAVWGCSFAEASNGMEMGLLASAILVIVNELLAPRPRAPVLVVGVALAVTARFEAALYVGLLAASVVMLPGRRRAFWTITLACAGILALLTVWRVLAFSDVLPNTYWAKRWPPYAAFGVGARIGGALELVRFGAPALVVLAAARFAGFRIVAALGEEHRRALPILVAPLVGAVVMGGAVGKAWGYVGRMPYFAFPLVLLVSAVGLAAWVDARKSGFRVGVAGAAFLAAAGLSFQGFPSGSLAAAIEGGSFGVTPHTYAESGRVFRRFADAAELRGPTVLSPDLGGVALTQDDFRLVDLGLLCSRTLGRRGPGALSEVLEAEAPAIIEAHWEWASASQLYELPFFRARYAPAFGGGTKLWLRRDAVETILGRGRGCRVTTDRADLRAALGAHRYADHDLPADREAFERAGSVVVLDEPAADASAGGRVPCP